MFDDIFSLYYELFVVNSCRSYCLNKFDISDRMNYFQSILKYFWNVQYGTRRITRDTYSSYFYRCRARGIILISRAWRTWVCYYYYAYVCYYVYYMRCFNFKYRQYNNRAVVYYSRINNTHGVLRVAKSLDFLT